MDNDQPSLRKGGCRCGQVRYEIRGEPTKVGLCHCTDCRRETGSAFLYYGDWRLERFSVTGNFKTYAGRSFCPECGTRLFHLADDSAEICLGSLDEAPTSLSPTREGWDQAPRNLDASCRGSIPSRDRSTLWHLI